MDLLSSGLTVGVGSEKHFKIEAVKRILERDFNGTSLWIFGNTVDTGVDAQPFSREDTIQGALNRSVRSIEATPGANIGFGIEGGVYEEGETLIAIDYAAIAIKIDDEHIYTFYGESESFILPLTAARVLREGRELSSAIQVYLREELGMEVEESLIKEIGAAHYLSNGRTNRYECSDQALSQAMMKMDEFLSV